MNMHKNTALSVSKKCEQMILLYLLIYDKYIQDVFIVRLDQNQKKYENVPSMN